MTNPTKFTNVESAEGYEINGMKQSKLVRVALASGNANAYSFVWQNPETSKIMIDRIMVNVTAAGGTATSVLDVGTAANATTASDNLIDGADANAIAVYDNIENAGTNGKSIQLMDANGGTTDHITGRILVANAASLAGYVYIHYQVI